MIGGSSPAATTTHGVLPPYLECWSLEHGHDPRTPKNLTRSGLPLRNVNGGRHYSPSVDGPTENLDRRDETIDGLDVAMLESGPEDGPLVICLHGFPDSAWTFRHLLPALAGAGFHAVAPFLRGYAPTGLAPDGAYQSGAIASDACALEERLRGDGPSYLVGHDWGALAAYGAAGWHAEQFAKIVTMAVPPVPAAASTFFSYEQIKRSFYVFFFQTALAEMVVAADDYEFLDKLWADWSPGYDAAWDLAKVKESIGSAERIAAAIAYYRSMLDDSGHRPEYSEPQQAGLGVPAVPTLYLHGADDGCMIVKSMDEVESVLPEGSEAVLVEGAGHFLHVERPGEVHAHVLRFLGQSQASSVE